MATGCFGRRQAGTDGTHIPTQSGGLTGRKTEKKSKNTQSLGTVNQNVKKVITACKSIKKEQNKIQKKKNPNHPSRADIQTEIDIREAQQSLDALKLILSPEYKTEQEKRLESSLKSETVKREQLEKEFKHMKDQAQVYFKENAALKRELKDKRNGIQNKERMLEELKNENNSNKDIIRQLQQDLSTKRDKIHKVECQVEQLQGNISELQYKLQKEIEAKDRALSRLSAMAAIRLKDNNPNITDLSDSHRPLKLSEKFTGLYDDEWTNAFEALEILGESELECIRILLRLITEIFTVCKSLSTGQMATIRALLVCPQLETVRGEIKPTHTLKDAIPASKDIMKLIKDYRKEMAGNVLPEIRKAIYPHLKHELNLNDAKMKACDAYIEKCVELCWYMLVQDPPMDLCWQFQQGDPFPSNSFRSYTSSGDKVDYVVWPTLYLFENGSVISKGVCQGLK